MVIRPLSKKQKRYLEKQNLVSVFEKQAELFQQNPRHPSLHTKVLEPKHFRLYSFRITHSVRAIFVYRGNDEIEIMDINNHYND